MNRNFTTNGSGTEGKSLKSFIRGSVISVIEHKPVGWISTMSIWNTNANAAHYLPCILMIRMKIVSMLFNQQQHRFILVPRNNNNGVAAVLTLKLMHCALFIYLWRTEGKLKSMGVVGQFAAVIRQEIVVGIFTSRASIFRTPFSLVIDVHQLRSNFKSWFN